LVSNQLFNRCDVVTRGAPWGTFQNNDRYWNVEVDFPASLDEEFAITTSKQQIVPSERIWKILDQEGVGRIIEQMRKNAPPGADTRHLGQRSGLASMVSNVGSPPVVLGSATASTGSS